MFGSVKAVAPGVRVEANEVTLPLAFEAERHSCSIVWFVVKIARRYSPGPRCPSARTARAFVRRKPAP